MRQLYNIFAEPFRCAKPKDYAIAALAIMVVAFGFVVIAIDEYVVYLASVVLMLLLAWLIKDVE